MMRYSRFWKNISIHQKKDTEAIIDEHDRPLPKDETKEEEVGKKEKLDKIEKSGKKKKVKRKEDLKKKEEIKKKEGLQKIKYFLRFPLKCGVGEPLAEISKLAQEESENKLEKEKGKYLPTIFKLSLLIEIFIQYTYNWRMPNRYLLVLDLDEKGSVKQDEIYNYVAPLITLVYCFVGNNFVQVKLVLFVALILGLISPFLNVLVSSPIDDLNARQWFLILFPYFMAIYKAGELLRQIVILEQLKFLQQWKKMRKFVFWFVYAIQFGNFLMLELKYLFTIVPSFTIMNSYFNFVICFLTVIIYFFLMKEMITTNPQLKVNTFYLLYKIRELKIRAFQRALEKALMQMKKNKKPPQVELETQKEQENILMVQNAKIFNQMILVITPLIIAGGTISLIKNVTFTYHALLMESEHIFRKADVYLIYSGLVLISLPIHEFILLPILKRVNLVKRPLQHIGLGLIYLLLALVFCIGIDLFLKRKLGDIPRSNTCQIRLYNVCNSSVTLKIKGLPDIRIKAYSKHEPTTLYCYTSYINVDVRLTYDVTKKTKNYKIWMPRKESRSCMVSCKGMTCFDYPEPLIFGPHNANNFSEARLYIISETKELLEIYIVSPLAVKKLIYPARKDMTILNLPENEYHFIVPPTTHSPVYNLESGSVYILIVTIADNTILNVTCFQVLPAAELRTIYSVIPQMFFLSLGDLVILISVFAFILKECPDSINATVMAYSLVLILNGFAGDIWVDKGDPLDTITIVMYPICLLLGFGIFMLFAYDYQYKINENQF